MFSENHLANQIALNPLFNWGRSIIQLNSEKNISKLMNYMDNDLSLSISRELIKSKNEYYIDSTSFKRKILNPKELQPNVILIVLESFLANQLNLSMFVQKDYKLIYNKSDFIWIGRGYPYRWIMFYRFDKDKLNTTSDLYDLFQVLLRDNDIGIDIYKNYREKMKLQCNICSPYVYRGIYSHKESQY